MRRDEIVADLQAAGLQRVRADEPLSRHTSWRIGGPADYLGVAKTHEALTGAIQAAQKHEIPWLVLGGGSNVLASDRGVDGVVIVNRIKGMKIEKRHGLFEVEAGSGNFFAQLALFTARQGYSGLEWGVAIPGTIGAGIVNNAGAHHGDVEKTLLRVEGSDPDGSTKVVQPEVLGFRYRDSSLKGGDSGLPVTATRTIITRAWFRIEPDHDNRALALVEELMRQRNETQPISEPSAGSTFKNPTGSSAGALIERVGLKGVRIGGAEFSKKHGNFIVNLGGASASDIVQLVHLARVRVMNECGVYLEPEVQVIGRWPQPHPLQPNPAASPVPA